MERKYTDEEVIYFYGVFKKYEAKFNRWLFVAWDFLLVDWLGLAEAAEESIKNNSPLTDEQISFYHGGKFEDGKVY